MPLPCLSKGSRMVSARTNFTTWTQNSTFQASNNFRSSLYKFVRKHWQNICSFLNLHEYVVTTFIQTITLFVGLDQSNERKDTFGTFLPVACPILSIRGRSRISGSQYFTHTQSRKRWFWSRDILQILLLLGHFVIIMC